MLLLSPEEYKAKGIPEQVWFYMPDLVNYIMSHRMKDSFFGGNGWYNREEFHKAALREEMKKGTHDAEDLNKEAFTFERKKTHREKDSDSGTFDVERYLNGDERPFTDVFTETTPKVSKTIIMELGANWMDRDDESVYRNRHRRAYAEVLKAEAEGVPVRVIAAASKKFGEFNSARKYYIIVKDYGDPIFPEIWGCLRSGITANATCNLISYTLVGTRDSGNGYQRDFTIDEDFPEDEKLIVIDPVRVKSERAKIIQGR